MLCYVMQCDVCVSFTVDFMTIHNSYMQLRPWIELTATRLGRPLKILFGIDSMYKLKNTFRKIKIKRHSNETNQYENSFSNRSFFLNLQNSESMKQMVFSIWISDGLQFTSKFLYIIDYSLTFIFIYTKQNKCHAPKYRDLQHRKKKKTRFVANI